MHEDSGKIKPNESPEQELWQRLRRHGDNDARTILIEKFLSFARTIAAKLYSNRPRREFEFDEYMQLATVGLIEAVDNYDPRQGASFKTYSSYRIRGAILNGVEKLNEKGAQGAWRRRYMEDRIQSIGGEGRNTDPDEGLFEEMVDVTIGLALGYMLEDVQFLRTDESDHESPYRKLEIKRIQQALKNIVKTLPEKEQQVIRYHYFEHMSFSEICQMMGLTKGRISQIHKSALARIKEAYTVSENFKASY